MKTNQKGFVQIGILIAVLLAIGAGGYYMVTKNNNKKTAENNQTVVETDMKTYQNDTFGFGFDYPGELTVVSSGPNEEQKKVARGEMISGTVPPVFDSITFSNSAKKEQFSVIVFDVTKQEISAKSAFAAGTACDDRFQKSDDKIGIIDRELIIKNGVPISKVHTVPDDPKTGSNSGCYFFKSSTGNLIAFNIYSIKQKADFLQVFNLVGDTILPTLRLAPIKNTQTPATIKIGKVAVDLADAKVLQESVDEGHQPWRLDPDMVVRSVMPDGSSQPVEVSIDSRTESLTYLVYFVVSNGKRYEVTITQPVRGQNKIWVVTDIEYATTTSAQNIPTQTKIYADPKNRFSITYPTTLTLQTSNLKYDNYTTSEQSTSLSAELLLQVSSSKIEMLTIGVSPDPKDVAKCMTVPESHPGNGTGAVSTIEINGASFLTYTRGETSLGASSYVQVYHTIHNNACWTITETTDRRNEDRLTKEEATAQKNSLEAGAAELDPIVQSFRFIAK